MALSNADYWNKLRDADPDFKSWTSKVTSDYFNEKTFEALKRENIQALDKFFMLPIRTALQQVNISHAKDFLDGFGETYDNPYGGNIQRLATHTLKPINPQYMNLVDRSWINQYIIRKPKVTDRYFTQNFNYQSLVTLTYDYHFKTIFLSEYGLDEFIAGIMAGLENGYIIQKVEAKKEAINAGINSTTYPLKDSQKVQVNWTTGTDEELKGFILAVMDVITGMTVTTQSSAFNALDFESTQDKTRLKLLVRRGYKNLLNVKTMVGAFNPQYLNLDVEIIETDDFGGLQLFQDAAYTTPAYPVYDPTLGDVLGYATTANATEVEFTTVYKKDPNENVLAILADKGWLFETIQNGYQVRTVENVAGLYRNFWASAPANAINIDPLYNVVVFTKAA